MASLDTISIAILFGSLLVLAGILSSLIALRFGAPLLLVFLVVGMLAGEGGPGGLKFDDVQATYVVGSIALALILFDGGLRTRFASFRNVLAPSVMLATLGVLVTTLITGANQKGEPVISFGAGEPDFATPRPIVEAAERACADPVNRRRHQRSNQK